MLAHEFEPIAQTIKYWRKHDKLIAPVATAWVEECRRHDGQATALKFEFGWSFGR